jgi:hypothetical protein
VRKKCVRAVTQFSLCFYFLFAPTASRYADGGQEDTTLQTGESRHVCLGNSRPIIVAKDLRSQHNSVGQFGESDLAQRRSVDGRYDQRYARW